MSRVFECLTELRRVCEPSSTIDIQEMHHMSVTAHDLIGPCLIGGVVALLILVVQYQAYRLAARHGNGDGMQGNYDPSLMFIAFLVLNMLLFAVPAALYNDTRWLVFLLGVVAWFAWLLGGVIVSSIALNVACWLLNKVYGWPKPPRGRAMVQAVLAVPTTVGIALLGFGIVVLGEAHGNYGPPVATVGFSLAGLVALLTVLAARIFPMDWEKTLLVTVLHGFFAVLFAVAAGAVWALVSFWCG